MYTVETDGQAKHQVDALPAEALAAYAELRVVLETAPWSGRPCHRDNPQGAVRARSFGTHGMVVYLTRNWSVLAAQAAHLRIIDPELTVETLPGMS